MQHPSGHKFDPARGVVSAFVRHPQPLAEPLSAPLSTDAFGTGFRYYACVNGVTFTSTSVRALAERLGRVTVNALALAESLAFGFVLRDETVLQEIRSIPPHSTLHPDGTLTTQEGPRKQTRITDADTAARRFRGLLGDVLTDLEPRWSTHCAGLTGGKDSRILAALPKQAASHWHWLTVSGKDDAEHKGSAATAERLGLEHVSWTEWTADFLAGDAHRVSADLANGVGAVSDNTLLRSAFEPYRRGALGTETSVALWIGTLADGLFAATYLQPPAQTLWDALTPRATHLSRMLNPAIVGAFDANGAYYRSNPFGFTPERDEDAAWFIRLLTRGRCFVCRSLGSFDHFDGAQVNPYLHPAMIALALETDPRLLASDALRDGVLSSLGPDLTGPSAFGYRAPAFAPHVFRALAAEVGRSRGLDGLVHAPLLEAMRDGRFPDLHPDADPSPSAAPAYRVHADTPQPIIRSLRDYEHLLMYVTFLNLLAENGVTVAGPA